MATPFDVFTDDLRARVERTWAERARTASEIEAAHRDEPCLKCNRPVSEHVRWTVETVATEGHGIAGWWRGHDPLLRSVGYLD